MFLIYRNNFIKNGIVSKVVTMIISAVTVGCLYITLAEGASNYESTTRYCAQLQINIEKNASDDDIKRFSSFYCERVHNPERFLK